MNIVKNMHTSIHRGSNMNIYEKLENFWIGRHLFIGAPVLIIATTIFRLPFVILLSSFYKNFKNLEAKYTQRNQTLHLILLKWNIWNAFFCGYHSTTKLMYVSKPILFPNIHMWEVGKWTKFGIGIGTNSEFQYELIAEIL